MLPKYMMRKLKAMRSGVSEATVFSKHLKLSNVSCCLSIDKRFINFTDYVCQCRDVRTREVGIQEIHHKVRPFEVGPVQMYEYGTLWSTV